VIDAPIIEYVDDACMFARWDTIAFPVFGSRLPTLDGVNAVAMQIEAHGRRVGKGRLTEITLLGADVRMPDAEVRQALDAMVPRLAPYYACVAAVFEGSGFRAAMIRGVLTGFQLISRLKYPHGVFETVADCACWVHATGVVNVDLTAISEAAREVRAMGLERGVLSGGVAASSQRSLPAPFRDE
jgi:hypothetical protein